LYLLVTNIFVLYNSNIKKQEREAAMLARKQGTYTILKDDDNIDDDHIVGGDDRSLITTASTSRKPDSHKKRFRKKIEVQDDQEDEAKCS
jgi:pre-mRNA-splicing factor ATP-dependent RNA helicase DHX16